MWRQLFDMKAMATKEGDATDKHGRRRLIWSLVHKFSRWLTVQPHDAELEDVTHNEKTRDGVEGGTVHVNVF